MSIYIYIYLYIFLFKERSVLFSIYICLYISIYIYIYFYIYLEKERNVLPFFLQKNETFSRSFPFFAKEHYVLFVLFRSLEKNGKERNILLGSDKSPKT